MIWWLNEKLIISKTKYFSEQSLVRIAPELLTSSILESVTLGSECYEILNLEITTASANCNHGVRHFGREAWLIRLEKFYFQFLQGKAYKVITNIEFTMMLFKTFNIGEELELLLDQMIRKASDEFTCEAESIRKETTANYFTYD
ncbi:hypothetical protein Ciccas_013364 [Cichlidogyrus casuarinus]|uniref:Uncharacterized protein n=1 Tax=Cichlidogyrus casuarinus TaxID=1844966 RepID=A0ABD2PLW6_9PLAT